MSRRRFVIGTRGSRLALRQAEIVLDALRVVGRASFQVRTIRTEGDRTFAPLSRIGGRGVFVAEIERALLEGTIDIAVHSLKDLPSASTAGLVVAAVLPREDPRDALVSRDGRDLARLPVLAVVGTGSPRRAAQLQALRSDIRVRDIRGNVDTRVRKVEEGEYDAVVLAAAGLARLGWLTRATQIFEPDEMLPAVGQGAIAVQVRSDDQEAASLVSSVDHRQTRVAVTAERAFERRLGGGCHAAVAAYADLPDAPADRLLLRGLVGGGGQLLRGQIEGSADEAEALGVRLAERLLEQGAAALLEVAS